MNKRHVQTAISCAAALIAGLLFTNGAGSAETSNALPGGPVRLPTSAAPLPVSAPLIPPAYAADLTTVAVMSAFGAQWRNMDVKIIEVTAMPTGAPKWKTTYDLQPKAEAANFDDTAWPMIEPKDLREQRGGGHLYMTWFRTTLTIPNKIGDYDPAGTKAALAITVDDYAEVWVNGEMLRAQGRISPATIQGYNMPNRVMLSESVKPGDKFQIAILAINGPISVSPTNAVFFREAQVEFFR